jgi:hypothetical protein
LGRAIKRLDLARSLAIWEDDLMAYGKPDYRNKWWLDLEDVNGELNALTTGKE